MITNDDYARVLFCKDDVDEFIIRAVEHNPDSELKYFLNHNSIDDKKIDYFEAIDDAAALVFEDEYIFDVMENALYNALKQQIKSE